MSEEEVRTSGKKSQTPVKPNMLRAVIGFAIYMLLAPAALFLAAGRLDWPIAWLYVMLQFVAIIGSRLISMWRHPDLLRERADVAGGKGAASWDKLMVPIIAILAPVIIMIVAGLDHRFGWPPDFAPVVQYVATFLIVVGYGVSVWAMGVNRFFSAVARIQEERGQEVVTSGPYRILRHPSYAGGLLAGLATPFMLNTLWALIPSIVSIVVLIIRTAFEDRMLLDGLEGYAAYAKRTRYRLIPGIW